MTGVCPVPPTQLDRLRAYGITETVQSFTNSISQQAGIDLPQLVMVKNQLDSPSYFVWTLAPYPPPCIRPGALVCASHCLSDVVHRLEQQPTVPTDLEIFASAAGDRRQLTHRFTESAATSGHHNHHQCPLQRGMG